MGLEAEWLDADRHLLVVEVGVLIQKASSSRCIVFLQVLVVSLREQATRSAKKTSPSWVLLQRKQMVVRGHILRNVVIVVFVGFLSSGCSVKLKLTILAPLVVSFW